MDGALANAGKISAVAASALASSPKFAARVRRAGRRATMAGAWACTESVHGPNRYNPAESVLGAKARRPIGALRMAF